MMSVNVSGNEEGLSVRKRQPVSEIFRTWQPSVENLLLNAAVAPFRTRRRREFRGSVTADTPVLDCDNGTSALVR